MQKCHLLLVTSVKEGWGLVVTEANSQGTPAVVYDVDGLRDSVKDAVTGLVAGLNTPFHLAEKIIHIKNVPNLYSTYRKNCWEASSDITFINSYTQFLKEVRSA